jgi:hypothetical protein
MNLLADMVAVYGIQAKALVAQGVLRKTPGVLVAEEAAIIMVVAAKVAAFIVAFAAAVITNIILAAKVVLLDLFALFGRAQTTHHVRSHQQTQVTCNEIIYPN